MTSSIPITLKQRPETLLHHARWLSHERGDCTAVILIDGEVERRITYEEFFANAAGYAQTLAEADIQRGDLVVLVMGHGENLLYAFWGAMLLGAVPSIFPFLSDRLDPDRYFDSIRQLVVHEGVKAIIATPELEAPLREHLAGIETQVLNERFVGARRALPLQDLREISVNGDDTAFLQHSSGSTGLQKGVMLSHQAVINQIASYSAAIRLSPDDVIVSWLPLYHDMGLIAGFILPILQSIPLILMSPFQWVRDPKILIWAIYRHRGTLCWLPNFAYNFLATRVRHSDLVGVDLSSWRAAINCSEPVYAESHRAFLEHFAPYGFRPEALATCYAMAENTFAVTQAGIDAPLKVDVIDRAALTQERRAVPVNDSVVMVSCGRAIPNCEINVVDDEQQMLPERAIGEIALRSDFMLTGYYKRPDATSEVMHDGWYLTGDMGYIADGELYITGRKKDLMIIGGKNVYPQDIENLLHDIPGIHAGRVVAFGVYNDTSGTEDVAIVAEVDHGDPEAQVAITREIRARIARNSDVTARYVHLVGAKWLIKTSSGKVARGANREKFVGEVLGKSV
jgi:fatty-acyl-CoA synthase